MLQIQKWRKKRGLSLSELARRSDITRGYLWQLENEDGKSPSGEILYRLSEALGVTMPVLMGKEKEKTRDIAKASVAEIIRHFAWLGFTDPSGHELTLNIEFNELVEKAVDNRTNL